MIVVIGGAGRLGRIVVTNLVARGEQVRVVSRNASRHRDILPSEVETIDLDVRDATDFTAAAEGATVIVMAAHGVQSRERDGLRTVDAEGATVVAAAASRPGARVVLVSSTDVTLDLTQIGAVKRSAEVLISPLADHVIIRAAPFAQTWAMILASSAAGSGRRPVIVGSGTTGHPFVDVRDVADIVTDAATGRIPAGTVTIVGPAELDLRALAALLREEDPTIGPPRHLPPRLAAIAAAVIGLVRPDAARQLRLACAMHQPNSPAAASLPAPDRLIIGRSITGRALRPDLIAPTPQ